MPFATASRLICCSFTDSLFRSKKCVQKQISIFGRCRCSTTRNAIVVIVFCDGIQREPVPTKFRRISGVCDHAG